MLLKLLFLVIVLLFVLKTVRSLVRVISNDGSPSRLDPDGRKPAGWQRNGPDQTSRDEDVEDAKYVDI